MQYWQESSEGNSSNTNRNPNQQRNHLAENSTGYNTYNNYGQMNAPNHQNTDPYSAAAFSGLQSQSFAGTQGAGYPTYQWDNQLLNENRDSSSACNSFNTVSHTPILSKAEVREPSQSLSLEADANPSPATENGVSSQVTPESSYSVDTFGSNTSNAENVDSSSVAINHFPSAEAESASLKFRSDEDGWEHTEIEQEHRGHHADNLSQTQSDPYGYMSSREASEVPFTGDNLSSEHQSENQSQPPVVAQVAPLLKQEQPIARVEPVTHANEQTNIQRVAPTRPSIPIEVNQDLAETTTAIADLPANVTADARTTEPFEIAMDTANVDAVPENSPERSAERDNDPVHNQQRNIFSPDSTQFSTTGGSPNFAPATSTPVQENADFSFGTHLRRGSSASIQAAISQNNHLPSLPTEQREEVNSDQQSDITTASVGLARGSIRGSYHDRYRGMKEKYLDRKPEVSHAMKRLDQYRAEPLQKRINPLMEFSSNGRRSVVTVPVKNARAAANISMDSNTQFREWNRTNTSSITHADVSFEHRPDASRNNGYGEDFVNASRRQRHNRSRPASRAKSEIDGNVSYNTAPVAQSSAYEMNGAMNHMYYGPSLNRGGRMSVALPSTQDYGMQYYRERPHSTFDTRRHERFNRYGGNVSSYDAYMKQTVEDESEESQSDEDEEDSDGDELRRYHANAHRQPSEYGYNSSMHAYNMPVQKADPRRFVPYGGDEMFFFGLIRLNKSAVDVVFKTMPPPKEFYSLPPMERAAYLYHASVYRKLYSSVKDFQNKFKREFYSYKCQGDNDNTALCKICKSMFDDAEQKVIAKRAEAYKASQKELFSDERGSIDGMSDRGSVYDHEADRMSDILSIDACQQAPKKYRVPHAFLIFGPVGRMVTINPASSVSSVEITDVKTMLREPASQRLLDSVQIFRGPLIVGRTPSHSVRLYIQRQIDMIRNTDVAAENPRANDVIDVLLLWQLLEIVVQQQGRVTGPDIARLLIAPTAHARLAHIRERNGTPSVESSFSADSKRGSNPESRAYDRFAKFLLEGHVEDAIQSALRDGLYADAMILTRRMFPGDQRRLAEIETRFLSTRPAVNPVMTLVAVASDIPAPVLANPPVDDSGSWRTHAAIVLANLSSPFAMKMVYDLGQVLAKRNYDAAADFCLLAVCLLGNYDVFDPMTSGEIDTSCRQHIGLIHASLPDNERDSTLCRFGFTLNDLHATEIFDYGLKLASRCSPLDKSIEYQTSRLRYAKLLTDFGGFGPDAFRYLVSVAGSIWEHCQILSSSELNDLADCADRLQFYAADEGSDTTWIANLRTKIGQLGNLPDSQQLADLQPLSAKVDYPSDQGVSIAHEDVSVNPLVAKSRSHSLASEARDWHADHQDPIQISPRSIPRSPSPINNSSSFSAPDAQANYDYGNSSSKDHSGSQDPSYQYDYYTPQVEATVSSNFDAASHGNTIQFPQTNPSTNSGYHVEPYFPNTDAPSTVVSNSQPPAPPTYSQPASKPEPVASVTNVAAQGEPSRSSPQRSLPVQASTGQSVSSNAENMNKLKPEAKKGSEGVLSKFVRRLIPDPKQMILPDDSNPSIKWDSTRNQWVGEGMEQTAQAAPPPPEMSAPSTSAAPTGGLRAARGSGGSRYFNPLNNANGGGAPPAPAPAMPSMPIPTSFNFIPQMPDDGDSHVDPFSGESNPTIHGFDSNSQSS